MKRTSAFLELAERIGKKLDGDWFVCNEFDYEEYYREKQFFIDHFKPTDEDYFNYKIPPCAWLSYSDQFVSFDQTIADNHFRILCLLLAHEIWCDTIDKE